MQNPCNNISTHTQPVNTHRGKLTTQVPRRPDTTQNHVRRDLARNVPDKQNRNQRVVLRAHETEILVQRVELRVDKRVAVEEIETVPSVPHTTNTSEMLAYKYMIHNMGCEG